MFNLFKKKSEKEILQTKYEKLMGQFHKFSRLDRKKSDEFFFQAHELLKKIETL